MVADQWKPATLLPGTLTFLEGLVMTKLSNHSEMRGVKGLVKQNVCVTSWFTAFNSHDLKQSSERRYLPYHNSNAASLIIAHLKELIKWSLLLLLELLIAKRLNLPFKKACGKLKKGNYDVIKNLNKQQQDSSPDLAVRWGRPPPRNPKAKTLRNKKGETTEE